MSIRRPGAKRLLVMHENFINRIHTHSPRIQGGILAAESRRLFERWLAGKEETEQAQFVKQLLALTPAVLSPSAGRE